MLCTMRNSNGRGCAKKRRTRSGRRSSSCAGGPLESARLSGGGTGAQRLPQHLPAKHLRTADVAARAAEQIDLELLELEERQQIGQTLIHGAVRACAALQPNLSVPCISALWPGKVHRYW